MNLLCETCGRPAAYVHLLPDLDHAEYVELACDEHAPGGLWCSLEEWRDSWRAQFRTRDDLPSHVVPMVDRALGLNAS